MTSNEFISYEDFINGNEFILCVAETVYNYNFIQQIMVLNSLVFDEDNKKKECEEIRYIKSSFSKVDKFSVENKKCSKIIPPRLYVIFFLFIKACLLLWKKN